ncbi:unnamed protein product [Heterosigma akashiwo]
MVMQALELYLAMYEELLACPWCGEEDRGARSSRRPDHHHSGGLHPRVRPGHPGRHQPPPGPELRQDVRHPVRGRPGQEGPGLADLLGADHAHHRRDGHGARRRHGAGAAPPRGPRAGGGHPHPQQQVQAGGAAALLREGGGRPGGRGRAGTHRRPAELPRGLEVQPLGAEGRARARGGGAPGHGAGHRAAVPAPRQEQAGTPRPPELPALLPALLEEIQAAMFAKAKAARDASLVQVTEWKDFVPALNRGNLVLTPFVDAGDWEDKVSRLFPPEGVGGGRETPAAATSVAAKTLCIPFDQPPLA